jgi:hypothetical protein
VTNFSHGYKRNSMGFLRQLCALEGNREFDLHDDNAMGKQRKRQRFKIQDSRFKNEIRCVAVAFSLCSLNSLMSIAVQRNAYKI